MAEHHHHHHHHHFQQVPRACDLGDVEFDPDDLDGHGDLGVIEVTDSHDDEDEEPNYPDLVPREDSRLSGGPALLQYKSTSKTPLLTEFAPQTPSPIIQPHHPRRHLSPELESALLMSVFLGTILFLYLFPAEPYEFYFIE